ncbi:recombination activating protein 1 [Streptomyces mutabilis]|nr:recombination activating protein 1 [Streptomyces mutabilis]
MNHPSVPQRDTAEHLPCHHCGAYEPADQARHTEPVHCGPCITCVDKPACFSCRLMYCVCDVHRYRG